MTELTIAKLPFVFIPNAGQVDRKIDYYVKGAGHGISFMEDGVVFAFLEPTGTGRQFAKTNEQQAVKGYAVVLRFLGANSGVKPEGRQVASGKANYLNGSDPAKWQTNLPTYEEIVYRELWPHVDMVFRGGNGRLKYEFVVQPGARIEDIQLTYRGADSLSFDESGNLVITTPTGTLTDERPIAIQEKDGQQIEVESAFLIQQDGNGEQSFGFVLGEGYDPQVPLVIDPGLVFSTLVGGSGFFVGDSPKDVAVDCEGGIYVTGITSSNDFPTTEGAFDRTYSGQMIGSFVTKLNAIGSELVYSTFVSGSILNYSNGIAVDSAGNAYVAGYTGSGDFPTTEGAYDRTLNDLYNGFIFKLNAQGSGLIYSTFLGGTVTRIEDIKIDSEGNAYVTGVTLSTDFPTTEGAYDRSYNVGGVNAFVTKLNATGSGLVYSTYLGRVPLVASISLALDAAGNVYVTGITDDEDYPTTEGAYDQTFNGGSNDAFVTKLNATGSGLVYSTFLGGSGDDIPNGIAVDSAGNAYVTGTTRSADFPTTEGAYDTIYSGPSDAFVTKLNATGSALVYSTLLGGSDGTDAFDITVDPEGNAYVTGFTLSADFPITDDAFQEILRGDTDAFLVKLNATGSALLYSSYLGGRGFDQGNAITLDYAGSVYVVGITDSPDFPTTEGAFDRTNNGNGDAFITKWNLNTSTTGADVSVAVADMPDPVPIGTLLTYMIQVRNDGPETATGVRLTDTLPLYVTFVSASSTLGDCSISGWVVTCEIGTILSGETVAVSITVIPTRTVQLPSGVCVTANEADPNPANNTVVITTTGIAKSPRQEFLDLIGMVDSLILAGVLTPVLTQVQASFLNNKLWAAIEQLDAGNVAGACSESRAFSQKVIAYGRDGILDVQTANQLLRIAAAIRRQLGCE